jgi:hypothetical protein
MDLPKLLDLLHFKSLYLRRADGFSDRLEGALFPALRESLDKAHAKGLTTHDADHFYRRARIGTYVSCWTIGAKDSMALWQLYGGVKHSIALTTTVDRLISAALSWNRIVHFYRVKYVNHTRMQNYVIGRYSDVLQFKHEAYRHEKELRIVVAEQGLNWESNPISLRLSLPNLDTIVRSVVVAPESGREFYEAVKRLCSKYDLHSPVRRSKLAFVPV